MIGVNKAIIVGMIERDCYVRQVGKSQKATFTVGVPEIYKDAQGVEQRSVDHIDVVCWGKAAEEAQYKAQQGVWAAITGRITGESWEQDGKRMYKQVVKAQDIRYQEAAPARPQQEQEQQLFRGNKERDTTEPF